MASHTPPPQSSVYYFCLLLVPIYFRRHFVVLQEGFLSGVSGMRKCCCKKSHTKGRLQSIVLLYNKGPLQAPCQKTRKS